MNRVDKAETDRLSEAIEKILPALQAFNDFQGPDRVGPQPATWMAALDEPLPERGVGLEPVLKTLAETIIPHGIPIGAPGFSGWVTTAPTTAGTAAALAATVAGAQRYWIQPFQTLEAVALRWLAELLGLPGGWFGILVSGGSVANLTGLGAAMFFSEQGFALGEKLARKTEQVDLDQNPDFQALFVEALALKAQR